MDNASWALALILISVITVSDVYIDVKHMSVTISIIIEVGQVDDNLNFLEKLNCHKWSIVLTTGLIDSGILSNSTFVTEITKYGEVLPAFWMAQTHDDSWKKGKIDDFISQWETHLGYKPHGVFMFQPDAYVTNYLFSKGIKYVQGYCFDQYAVDWMSMRGGWQQPYYASSGHILVPASEGKGIVVLPHVIWDWRDSFELDHQYNSHPVDAWVVHDENYQEAKNYVLKLMNATLLGVEPIAYFTSQNEIFGWGGDFKDETKINHTDFFQSIIDNAEKLGATLEMFNETVEWFTDHYSQNPTYTVNVMSPYSNQKSEWFWNNNYRITRYDAHVVGYIQYKSQNDDPYLTSIANPDFKGDSHAPDNCVDNSLTFTIDDFGEGQYRAPPRGDADYYSRPLRYFPIFHIFPKILHGIFDRFVNKLKTAESSLG